MSKNRKLNRKRNYDYSIDGWYFVTIVTGDRIHHFGEIIDSKMHLNEIGRYSEQCWININEHFPHIFVDDFIIMPNHIHGILQIDWGIVENGHSFVGNNNYCSLRNYCSLHNHRSQQNQTWQTKWSKTISSAIRGFKIGVTKFAHNDANNYNFSWQKSFHDRIIRNEREYINIKNYIQNNPLNWNNDVNH